MNLIPDELKTQTFPCPHCSKYISSEMDVCKFCSNPISSDMKGYAISKELEEKRKVNLNRQKNTVIIGVGLLAIGILLLLSSVVEMNYSQNVNINCLTPVFIVAGIVAVVKGLIGYNDEKRKF